MKVVRIYKQGVLFKLNRENTFEAIDGIEK